MHNKYTAYSYVSIKTLFPAKSLFSGFLFNLIIALIVTTLLLIFKPDIPFIGNIDTGSDSLISSLNVVKGVALIIVFFLFSNVAIMMQNVFEDRDSKVSEVISTSITEKHYLFGKLVTSFYNMLVVFISMALAIFIASMVYSLFSSTFNVFTVVLAPIFSSFTLKGSLFFAGCVLIVMIMLATSILFTLSLAIKINSLVDAAPVALIILLPYMVLFGLFIFLPTSTVETWILISTIVMFIPIFSPLFILIYAMLNGFELLTYLAILISVIYGFVLFGGVSNIYKYAFYTREKLSLTQLLKLSVKEKAR
ncbi:hypothetical protein [Jeotgalibacillus marinus]|uniref:ABC transporter permease n=1 Tax=Jeotgalibacillus marinus TaxID=86667 RepID=A0ABV3Q338_9BACL